MPPTIVKDYQTELLNTMKELAGQNKWWSSPLNLGGAPGPSGGSGAPVGGTYGFLPQTKVAYDSTEGAYLGINTNTPSGTLYDNLSHIRYRITNLETISGSSILDIWHSSSLVASGITVINFTGDGVGVSDDGSGQVTVTISGGASGSGGHTIEDEGVALTQRTNLNFVGSNVTVTDDFLNDTTLVTISGGSSSGLTTVTEDLTSQIPAFGNLYNLAVPIISGSLSLHLNGLLQRPSYFSLQSPTSLLTTFTTETGDELVATYLTSSGISQISSILNLNVASGVIGVFNESLSDQIPGSTFTVANEFVPDSLRVYWNGVRQDSTVVTENANNSGFSTSFSTTSGDTLFVDYDVYSANNVSVSGVTSGGSSTFLGLTDTPSSYTGDPYRVVQTTASGLEFSKSYPYQSIDRPKTFTDTADDEFSSGLLDDKWTVVAGEDKTVEFLESSLSSARYDLATRPGWLLLQANNNHTVELRQDFTLANNKSIIMELSPTLMSDADTGITNNELWIGMALNDNDTSYDSGNFQAIFFDANTDGWRLIHYQNGSITLGDTAQGTSAYQGPFATRLYFRLARANLTYYGFISLDGTTWMPIGSATVAGAYSNLWIFVDSKAAFGTPIPIQAIDWIREGTNEVDPWRIY